MRISILVACASALQIAESLLPHPVPWFRLGLANMVTLVSLALLGAQAAVQVSVLRTVLSSLVLGTFLTPGFILSFLGGVVSALVMAAIYSPNVRGNSGTSPVGLFGLSLFGVSIIGAVSHNLTQLVTAYFILLRHKAVFLVTPYLILAGIITGLITGYGAHCIRKRLEKRWELE